MKPFGTELREARRHWRKVIKLHEALAVDASPEMQGVHKDHIEHYRQQLEDTKIHDQP